MALSDSDEVADQLSLFGAEVIDVVKVRDRISALPARIQAAHTLRSYASDWKQFAAWCHKAGRQALPASAETMELYVGWLLMDMDGRKGGKISSSQRKISAVTDFHRSANVLVPDMAKARAVIRKVRDQRGGEQPQGKTALARADLIRAAEAVDTSTNRGKRDLAILIVGFASSLRRANLTQLKLADVKFKPNGGFNITVGREKNNRSGASRVLSIWPGERASTDPVQILRNWIEARGDWKGPLFCHVQNGDAIERKRLLPAAIARVVKECVENVGLDSSVYAGHSLRSGAVTAAAEIGRSDSEIQEMSGHKSVSVMRTYIRRNGVFTGRNPLEGVL